jgi:hypothetical protein
MPADSPWKTLAEAGARVGRGKRFMRNEWKAGRLRGACIGGRQEIFTSDQWVDEWVQNLAARARVPIRKRA